MRLDACFTQALEQANIAKACVCGVSYGGLVAAAFAARYPGLAQGLILVSAIPPTWTPDYRARFYVRAPRVLMPLFMLASLRMYKEISAAAPGPLNGVRAAARHGLNVLMHMFSPSRMARRVQFLQSMELQPPLETVSVPTLVITGEDRLDRVVPVIKSLELQRQFEAIVMGWSVPVDPDQFVVWHSSEARPEGLNNIQYSNPEVDRLLGAVLEYADTSFNTILELGFATSIRREYDWRVSRGESTRNLDAFKGWLEPR